MFPGACLGGAMKKKTKKLVLAKETVRRLETSALRDLVGGATDVGCTGQGYECNPLTGMSCRFCDVQPIEP
jgi:natural product precursor